MPVKISRRKIQDKLFGNTQNTAIGVQQVEMADARLGAMYFLGKTRMEKVPSFSLDLIGAFVSGTTAVGDLKNGCQWLLEKTNAGRKVVGAISAVGEKLGEGIAAIKEKLKHIVASFFQGLINKVKKVYGEALYGIEWISEFGVWAVSSFAGSLADCIPGWGYVQSLADMYDGTRTAVLKAKDFIEQMWSGYGVHLLGGQPSIIANALARHSVTGIAGGIKDLALGVTSLGLEAAGDAAGGAGTIVSAVTGVLQRIANLVDYIIQRYKVNSIFKYATKQWDNHMSATSIVHKHKEFSEWFQKAVVCTPIVAALTLGSGFVAHPYKFLQLLNPDDKIVSQAEFDKGVKHIETLKKISGNYISEYTDNYSVQFTSDDGLVAARLSQIQEGKGVLHNEEMNVTLTPEQMKKLYESHPLALKPGADVASVAVAQAAAAAKKKP